MKQGKLLAVLGFLIVLGLFLMMRPVREKACPLTDIDISNDPDFIAKCNELRGVIRDGKCVCRSGVVIAE